MGWNSVLLCWDQPSSFPWGPGPSSIRWFWQSGPHPDAGASQGAGGRGAARLIGVGHGLPWAPTPAPLKRKLAEKGAEERQAGLCPQAELPGWSASCPACGFGILTSAEREVRKRVPGAGTSAGAREQSLLPAGAHTHLLRPLRETCAVCAGRGV